MEQKLEPEPEISKMGGSGNPEENESTRGQLLAWIQARLTGWQQRLALCSSWADVLTDMPQASVFGLLLFLIFINDQDKRPGQLANAYYLLPATHPFTIPSTRSQLPALTLPIPLSSLPPTPSLDAQISRILFSAMMFLPNISPA